MPTPFTHLYLTDQFRTRLAGQANSNLLDRLSESWPAFYFGNVAPDYQSLCDVPREVTHFYSLPPLPLPNMDAGAEMLSAHPSLKIGKCATSQQAAFVAGYLSHLLVDLAWIHTVLIPYFVESRHFANIKEGILTHNLSLIVLDEKYRERLSSELDRVLLAAEPDQWLPFADDENLITWRDYLADQLADSGVSYTVDIYADRMSIPPSVLRANLNDVEWMDANLMTKVPLPQIEAQLEATIEKSMQRVGDYLAGVFPGHNTGPLPNIEQIQ
ncbi:MAG: zinc dependent phospholipase C family protein [Chloroflexota bacterium]